MVGVHLIEKVPKSTTNLPSIRKLINLFGSFYSYSSTDVYGWSISNTSMVPGLEPPLLVAGGANLLSGAMKPGLAGYDVLLSPSPPAVRD